MSQWEKLLNKLKSTPYEMRYEDFKKVLEYYGYAPVETKGGSSHITFRKAGCLPITIPRHGRIKREYIELVKAVVEEEHYE